MWESIDVAKTKYPGKMNKYTNPCKKYALHWDPISKAEANENLRHIFPSRIRKLELNTPSLGRVWCTNPVYRYIGGNEIAFVKCGKKRNITNEYETLNKMRNKGVPVPSPLGLFTEQNAYLIPRPTPGAIVITEFLHSVSLGHAIVDERFCLNCLRVLVHQSIRKLHEAFLHGELTHKHVRVCVTAKDAKELIFQAASNSPQIIVKDVIIVDPADSTDYSTVSINQTFEYKKKGELQTLRKSVDNYLTKLEGSKNKSNFESTLKPEERRKRFRSLLDAL